MKTKSNNAVVSTVLLCGALALSSMQAHAGALFTLKGQTLDARLATESEVRVSVLGWTEADKAKAVAEQFRQAQDGKASQFAEFLAKQDTQGYVFTAESVGYSIKYAWETNEPAGKRMVLAVTPALKSHNPYMWKQTDKTDAGYTLLEVQWQGNEALLRTSADAPVTVNLQGKLELQDDKNTRIFARLQDDTPYYLKKS